MNPSLGVFERAPAGRFPRTPTLDQAAVRVILPAGEQSAASTDLVAGHLWKPGANLYREALGVLAVGVYATTPHGRTSVEALVRGFALGGQLAGRMRSFRCWAEELGGAARFPAAYPDLVGVRVILADQVLSLTPMATPRTTAEATIPYAAVIRSLVSDERLDAARQLLVVALRDVGETVDLGKLREVLAPPRTRPVQQQDPDRTEEYRWLAAHEHQHAGRWVALQGDNLLAAAESLKALLALLKGTHPQARPLIHRCG